MLLSAILPALLCVPAQECASERDGRVLCHPALYATQSCTLSPKPIVQYSCVKEDGTSYIWDPEGEVAP